jgi:uncharacterized C2H2 Zn-finger protein
MPKEDNKTSKVRELDEKIKERISAAKHIPKDKFRCPDCGAMFHSPEDLESHVEFAHSSDTTKIGPIASTTTPGYTASDYDCSICGARFDTEEQRDNHVKTVH